LQKSCYVFAWNHAEIHSLITRLSRYSGYDGTEGRWKALQASGIYERRSYLTEVYRNALAREVRLLGYAIDSRVNPKGRDCGFEIRGISDELLTKYSQRSRESIMVITSDKERLRETVARSTARQSASELARSPRPGLQQGMNRGFEAACKLARRAAQYMWSTFRRPRWHGDAMHEPRMERTHDLSIDR
jgi:hypothetical protein